MPTSPESLRGLLSGGDRRSQALSHLVLPRVRGDRRGIDELARLTADEGWLVAMRALDLLEKLAHEDASSVEPHTHVFLGELADNDKWEVRLQIVRARCRCPGAAHSGALARAGARNRKR